MKAAASSPYGQEAPIGATPGKDRKGVRRGACKPAGLMLQAKAKVLPDEQKITNW